MLDWLKRINHVAHNALVIMTTVCLIFAGFTKIEHQLDLFSFSDAIEQNIRSLLYVFLLISVLIIVFTMILLRHTRTELERVEAERSKNTETLSELTDSVNNIEQCKNYVRALSSRNAKCDKDIFHLLFLDLCTELSPAAGGLDYRAAVDVARRIVDENISDVLDAVASIFTSLTGDKCSACIQVLQVKNKNKHDGIVKTIARDRASSADRSQTVQGTKVGNNTTHRSIFVCGNEYFIENDLETKIRQKIFHTTSRGWKLH